jgi:fructose-1,6-bisphosphatase I
MLKKYLEKHKVDKGLIEVITDSVKGICEIYDVVRKVPFNYSDSTNSSGETQLSHDILADGILKDIYEKNDKVRCIVSEEQASEICFLHSEVAPYKVAFDPLDGSSVAAHNVTVGTSIGIYLAKNSKGFEDLTGNDLVGAVYGVYGPRLMIGLSIGEGVILFRYENGEFVIEKENMKVNQNMKYASFGGMQKSYEIGGFPELIEFWQDKAFKLRYTGSMATDLNAILMRGGGIFAYPYKKLRKLYECNPFAFIIEQAGGKATDICGNRILDLKVESIDESVEIVLGSSEYVDSAVTFFKKQEFGRKR